LPAIDQRLHDRGIVLLNALLVAEVRRVEMALVGMNEEVASRVGDEQRAPARDLLPHLFEKAAEIDGREDEAEKLLLFGVDRDARPYD
jgi:hypothetical protein